MPHHRDPHHRTRRDFLLDAGAVAGALALTPLVALAGEAASAAAPLVPSPAPAPPALSVARWALDARAGADLGAVARRLTQRALDALGGMGRFVGRGDVVWVKPNIAWNRGPELAANTNPDVVATLVRLCLEAGARKVKVGDHSCDAGAQTYAASGIAAAARAAGAEVLQLDPRRFREAHLGGERLKSWPIYPELVECDLVINVPVVKHHGLAEASLAMKNYMGVVGGRRGTWHQEMAQCLVDITAFMKPRLCVLDAVRVLTGHGPQGGDPKDVKALYTVAAGTDIVALDAFGATLLGHDPRAIAAVAAGARAGLGEIDFAKLAPVELVVS